ncbi:MAG TPA: asparaginase domain-containing protein, partial [Solirubrobacteraceae bacterium]|nr:asparaginase domain-containing protein [Solirubrobacteraceae bacterium]
EVESPFEPPLDSADVGPDQWTTLVKLIVSRQDEFDGVVIAHGTDTMAYTASAVSFALGRELSFPVVFTGSQTTVDVLHGDALANILRASLVATQDLPEVVVSFGERVFRATRTQKKDDLRFDAFESPGYPELGFVAEEVQIFRRSVLDKPEVSPPLSNISSEFASGILHVSQMPGSEAAFYEAALRVSKEDAGGQPMCRGIIIQSLGAGNIPTKSPPFDLTNLISEAKRRFIPVVLTSQYPVLPANYQRYSPVAAAIAAGAIPTGNMTISAVVAKLSWVIPQVDREIEVGMLRRERRLERVAEMMGREYVGEGGLTVVERLEEGEKRHELEAV